MAGVELPMAGVGLPIAGVGLPRAGVGLPRAGVGLPWATVGFPFTAGVGLLLTADVGLPRAGVGLPLKAGTPLASAGTALSGAGVGLPAAGVVVPPDCAAALVARAVFACVDRAVDAETSFEPFESPAAPARADVAPPAVDAVAIRNCGLSVAIGIDSAGAISAGAAMTSLTRPAGTQNVPALCSCAPVTCSHSPSR